MDKELQGIILYWVVGLVISFMYLVYFLHQDRRNGKLTKDKVGGSIIICLGISVMWPVAVFITLIDWGAVALFWFTQKLVQERHE